MSDERMAKRRPRVKTLPDGYTHPTGENLIGINSGGDDIARRSRCEPLFAWTGCARAPPAGSIRRRLDPGRLEGLSDETLRRIDALTPEQIEACAASDPEHPPLMEEELKRGAFGRRVRRTREGLQLSQKAFAERCDINLRTLQDWEQGRAYPDSAAMTDLRVIVFEPEAVRRVRAQPADDRAAKARSLRAETVARLRKIG